MLRSCSLAFALFVVGCGNTAVPPSQAPIDLTPLRPPTPVSITKAQPGGDSDDPEAAALQRLLDEPFELKRKDRWGTLRVPLADWRHWRRIRIWGHPTRAAFQYGDDHTAMILLRYSKIEGPNDPQRCLADFVKYASPVAQSYGIRLGESRLVTASQSLHGEPSPMLIRLQDGGVDSIVANDDYLAFMAAYQSWPGTCLVQAFAVVSTDHPELAARVRDRWVAEAAGRLIWDKKVKSAPDTELVR